MLRRFRCVLLLALVPAGLLADPWPQQAEKGTGLRQPGVRRPGMRPSPRKGPPGWPARQNMVDHLMSLPPEQQQEFMRNSPLFRRLPPKQQQNIQERLDEFNRLPLDRRQALRERYELFRQLSPEQQDRARTLYRQWNQYPPGRRQELMRGFRDLRDISPDERRRQLDSEEFRSRFNEREQETLRGLVELLPDGS